MGSSLVGTQYFFLDMIELEQRLAILELDQQPLLASRAAPTKQKKKRERGEFGN
jgi:hypothetical protein